jgi:phosphatidylinositol alpha-1,6-mannosyltransferase
MTIMLVSDNFPPRTGGSGRWFWEIYRRLPRTDVLIAAGQHPRQEEFDQTHDVRVTRLPLTQRKWGLLSREGRHGYAAAIGRLRRLVREHGIQMVHCARCLPEGVMSLALRWLTGVPYCCYVHGEDVTAATTSREQHFLAKQVLRRAAGIIANSHNTERILLDDWRLSPERVHVLHPGVDTKRFVPAPRDDGVRARLGWAQRRVVLTVGRLQKRKGQDMMIRALSAIRRAVPDVLYAILGDGDERASLEQLVDQEGVRQHVQFLGEADDRTLVRCYQQCNLFALPNRQVGMDIEGFGMVLLEAQACGRPVLAGASGGTAETMQVPDTGRIVPCDGPEALAGTLTELLRQPDLLERMGRAGRAHVIRRFDWVALTRQAERLFSGQLPVAADAAEAALAEAMAAEAA